MCTFLNLYFLKIMVFEHLLKFTCKWNLHIFKPIFLKDNGIWTFIEIHMQMKLSQLQFPNCNRHLLHLIFFFVQLDQLSWKQRGTTTTKTHWMTQQVDMYSQYCRSILFNLDMLPTYLRESVNHERVVFLAVRVKHQGRIQNFTRGWGKGWLGYLGVAESMRHVSKML